jgi:hypothetical protein
VRLRGIDQRRSGGEIIRDVQRCAIPDKRVRVSRFRRCDTRNKESRCNCNASQTIHEEPHGHCLDSRSTVARSPGADSAPYPRMSHTPCVHRRDSTRVTFVTLFHGYRVIYTGTGFSSLIPLPLRLLSTRSNRVTHSPRGPWCTSVSFLSFFSFGAFLKVRGGDFVGLGVALILAVLFWELSMLTSWWFSLCSTHRILDFSTSCL